MAVRLLVLEGNAEMRALLEDLLRGEGYDVASAADGFEALKQLRDDLPRAMLVDLDTAGRDCNIFVESIRELGLRPGIPLLALATDPGGRQDALRLGADSCLTKPFGARAVVQAVDRLVTMATAPPPDRLQKDWSEPEYAEQ
jgi:CheY-like chemotaxis protein